MQSKRALALGMFALLFGAWTSVAHAGIGWGVGVTFGAPVYYRPYPYWGVRYYSPYPYRVGVYVDPYVPVYAPPATVQVVQPVYQAPAPAPAPIPAPTPVIGEARPAEADRLLQQLADPSEQTRADSAIQLGRMRVQRAVDPLVATLAGDRSVKARESAARALGLIGSPKALPALKKAAQADDDRDVRHSASFSIDVIQATMQR